MSSSAAIAVPESGTIQLVLAGVGVCVVFAWSILLVRLSKSKQNRSMVVEIDEEDEEKTDRTVYAVLTGLATGNPQYHCPQEEAMLASANSPGIKIPRNTLERIYGNSRISSRYFAVPDATPHLSAAGDGPFYPADGSYEVPVDVRLEKFKQTAAPIMSDVARRAIRDAGISDISEISKLVVVSSTGFSGPGLDCALIKDLGLPRSVDRTLIGLMGCAAAINGFRVASDYVRANPGKRALMICIELPSVHSAFQETISDAVVHAIFGDGCAAAVLTGSTRAESPKGSLAMVASQSWLMEDTDEGIVLGVTPNGITCKLSKYLRRYVADNVASFVDGFLQKNGLQREDVDMWCVHPGGRGIIEEAEKGLGLTEEQHTFDSWAVLAEYGNMLSPTIMFVLCRWVRNLRCGQPQFVLNASFDDRFSWQWRQGHYLVACDRVDITRLTSISQNC
ncbi:unnamed protein product [Scytosiphon promiscuus]